jgi:hypothetical protein
MGELGQEEGLLLLLLFFRTIWVFEGLFVIVSVEFCFIVFCVGFRRDSQIPS